MNLAPVGRVVDWLSYTRNRRKVYTTAKFVLPVAVVYSHMSPGVSSELLTGLSVVLGFGVPHLADKNTGK